MSDPSGRIGRRDVLRLAELSRLELDSQEADRLAGDLATILDYVARLEALDLEGVPPFEALDRPHPLREDVVRESLGAERGLATAPRSGEGHFKVPRVIE